MKQILIKTHVHMLGGFEFLEIFFLFFVCVVWPILNCVFIIRNWKSHECEHYKCSDYVDLNFELKLVIIVSSGWL
jgi:hypothetical protein